MTKSFEQKLSWLAGDEIARAFSSSQRGIEKEGLRVNTEGGLAQSPHPKNLGAALTHPQITTDFSEALLEIITVPNGSIQDTLSDLHTLHVYISKVLEHEREYLWAASMPCHLEERNIPLAQYGSSYSGQLKTLYRLGLSYRYGRSMQTVAGIHYNFSLSDTFWEFYLKHHLEHRGDDLPLRDFIDQQYMSLIRNFQRYMWLILYLFSASPLVSGNFLTGREHPFKEQVKDSFGLPLATSLRMSALGYQSTLQRKMKISYNTLDEYANSLRQAIITPCLDYQSFAPLESQPEHIEGETQLGDGLLQIENEYYNPIRPKCATLMGETLLHALKTRGISYLEVRCIDLNPYLPMGIDSQQSHFLDAFLSYCLIDESPPFSDEDMRRNVHNFDAVVHAGRDPQLTLDHDGEARLLRDYAHEVILKVERIAEILDRMGDGASHLAACAAQRNKIAHPETTPSGKMMDHCTTRGESFFEVGAALSLSHHKYFEAQTLEKRHKQQLEALRRQSLTDLENLETKSQNKTFAEFVRERQAQYLNF